MAEADALEGGSHIAEKARDEELVAAALLLARQVTEDSEGLVATILRQRQQIRAGEVASPMADDLSRIVEMVQKIDTRLTLLESGKEDAVPGPRVRLFVAEVVSPLRDSVAEIRTSIKSLSDESKELYEAHKAFIDAEQKRKEKEAEERTPMGMVKRYLPLVTLVGGSIAVFRALGTLFEFYLAARSK